jgi:hypothetical protein
MARQEHVRVRTSRINPINRRSPDIRGRRSVRLLGFHQVLSFDFQALEAIWFGSEAHSQSGQDGLSRRLRFELPILGGRYLRWLASHAING